MTKNSGDTCHECQCPNSLPSRSGIFYRQVRLPYCGLRVANDGHTRHTPGAAARQLCKSAGTLLAPCQLGLGLDRLGPADKHAWPVNVTPGLKAVTIRSPPTPTDRANCALGARLSRSMSWFQLVRLVDHASKVVALGVGKISKIKRGSMQ